LEGFVIGGYITSAVLAASGMAGVIAPQRIGPAIDTVLGSGRSKAEFRVAYGAIGAFGVFALAAGDPEVFKAVGAFWLGAAVVRLLSIGLDRPRLTWTFWAFFVLEIAAGLAGVLGSG